jgi:serine/threonine-protein kinase RsbT
VGEPWHLACFRLLPRYLPMQTSAIKYEPYMPYMNGSSPAMTALPGRDEIHIPVESDVDIVAARQKGRALAARLGFSSGEATMVATAISELARNIVLYAARGEIVFGLESHGEDPTLVITARDEGAGIADVRQALQDGYSTSGRLGVGLPGVKRLMDEFEISSTVGLGTVVVVKKWKQ